jgi:hypothetical protein
MVTKDPNAEKTLVTMATGFRLRKPEHLTKKGD